MVPVDGQEGPADVCVIELGGTIGTIISFTCFDMNYFPVSERFTIDFLVQGTSNLCHILKHLVNFHIVSVRPLCRVPLYHKFVQIKVL